MPSTKKKKDKTSQKHWDGDKNKVKSHNPSSANINQPQISTSKKNKCHGSYQRGNLATKINAIEIGKKKQR